MNNYLPIGIEEVDDNENIIIKFIIGQSLIVSLERLSSFPYLKSSAMAAPAEIVTSIPDSTVNIVIGAGVMGISAALALKRTHPERSIYLLNDFSTTVEPASRDTGKIVRRKYVSPQYVALADEAIGLWKGEVSYEQIWHGCGWWVVGLAGAATRSLDVVLGDRQGQGHGSSVSIKDKTAQDRFRELFPLADMNSIAHLEYDASAAWVDASAALEATLKMAEDAGVVVKDCKVSRLLWKDDSCVGVDLSNGDVINAASVLLAMGPETPGLLNLPKNVGERVGVSLLGVQLTTEQYEKYKDMPILAVDHRGEHPSFDSEQPKADDEPQERYYHQTRIKSSR